MQWSSIRLVLTESQSSRVSLKERKSSPEPVFGQEKEERQVVCRAGHMLNPQEVELESKSSLIITWAWALGLLVDTAEPTGPVEII